MQERTARVFLVATANAVEELPPEMIRKGRLDEIFFVDLPAAEAAGGDLPPPSRATLRSPATRFDLAALASASAGFSGAEIEQAVVSALYEARASGIALDTSGILVALRSTRPLSVVRAEPIAALRAWAAGRCVPAD